MINWESGNRSAVSDLDLALKIEMISNSPVVGGLLHATGGLLAVLDDQRRILTVNDVLLRWLGIGTAQDVLGLRPGQALHCTHAQDAPGGCGTGPTCLTCGAAIALVTSLAQDSPVERTCTLTCQQGAAQRDLYLRVQACPLHIDGRRILLLFLQDITAEQQACACQRIFFHDIANIVTALSGFGEGLKQKVDPGNAALINSMVHLLRRLESEVQLQRTLANPDLPVAPPIAEELALPELIEDLKNLMSVHPCAVGKRLTLPRPIPEISLKTTGSLVLRVLANMLTNAFEASDPGEEVLLWAECKPEAVTIRVWNRRPIAPEVTERIFQRNFSTKATLGRGLGTYSMKLITEQYLHGQITFSTSLADGTVFQVTLPRA